jgi:hypothetical protein
MAMDLKYGKVTFEKGAIGEDEPVFVLRAQDACAIHTMEWYRDLAKKAGCPDGHIYNTEEAVRAFDAWPGEKKLPD